MTITITWWMIPTTITVIAVCLALAHDDGGGMFSGIINMFLLVPALLVSLIAWVIGAIFK